MFFSTTASGQCRIERLKDSTMIFSLTHQDPQFRGGRRALEKYLQDNIQYPTQALKDSVEGRVVVQFVIDSLGYVGETKVLRSVREDLDQEALRVVKSLPRFSSGRENGKSVNVE
jgi:protein TonB